MDQFESVPAECSVPIDWRPTANKGHPRLIIEWATMNVVSQSVELVKLMLHS